MKTVAEIEKAIERFQGGARRMQANVGEDHLMKRVGILYEGCADLLKWVLDKEQGGWNPEWLK